MHVNDLLKIAVEHGASDLHIKVGSYPMMRLRGVWTTNVSKAHQVAKSLRAGSVWVNCYQAMDPAVPFGGYKMSGYGRESGKQHLEQYLNVKAVWIKTG